jgi:tetratricopeptide (TPR) repeat protein
MKISLRYSPLTSWMVALLILGVWGCAKLAWERKIHAATLHLRGATTTWSVDVRDQIGQGTALALLSGFRGVVADYLWIGAHLAWERNEWHRLLPLYEMICMLQPRAEIFWDLASWHLAWNVAQAARYDTLEPVEARRIRSQRRWIESGRSLLERGVAINPDSGHLWFSLGWIYDQRLRDLDRAVECYRRAAALPGAAPYVRRLIGYRLEQAGHELDAYNYWRELWASFPDKSVEPYMLWDRILIRIRELETRLAIPSEKRLVADPGTLPQLPPLP